MGSETWADYMFPPSPSTLYGAIRTFLIFQRGGLKEFEEKGYDDIGKIVKNDNGEKIDKKGTLKISGPFLFYEYEILFPAPLDLVEQDKKLIPLTFINKPQTFISNYLLEKCLVYKPTKEKVEQPSGWLTLINFKDYLKNKKGEFNFIDTKDKENSPYLMEPKIGIAREPGTLTSKEGYLYRIPMIRLSKEAYFVIEVEGLSDSLPDKGVFQLGGEGKGVSYEVVSEDILTSIKNFELNFENNLFKIYLATPAIFKKGWLPGWIDEGSYTGEYNGIKLKLIACAIGRPIFIGGWDIANKRPKPMKKAAPPGSVYYFEIIEGSVEKVKNKFHFKNISDVNPEEGFGLSIVGEVVV